MKRIISLLLALICVFAFVSCGEETTPIDQFINVVNSSAPTKIITQTSYSDSETTFRGRFETTIYASGSEFEMSYNYQDYANPETAANPDEYIANHKGVVYYRAGLYSTDGVNWTAESPNVTTMQVKFELSAAILGEFEISKDGKTLTATVTAEQAEKILGVAVSATEDGVEITVTHDGNNLRGVLVSYSTEYASIVTLETSYSYNAVTSPFEPEQTPQE